MYFFREEPKIEILKLRDKTKNNPDYEPIDKEIEIIKDLIKNPEIYLDEGQLQKIYDYPQGTIWDFFLHAFGIKKIPSIKRRIEKGFHSYIDTYNFTDNQIKTLRRIKDIFVANKLEKKEVTVDDIFSNPIFEKLVGSRAEVEMMFDNKFDKVINNLEKSIKI